MIYPPHFLCSRPKEHNFRLPSCTLNKQHYKNNSGIVLIVISLQTLDIHSTITNAEALFYFANRCQHMVDFIQPGISVCGQDA
jgi:hypothetical protein